MSTIKASVAAYEQWLRASLGADLVAGDLDEKHKKMRKSAFAFLRATYWRWAETILAVCPALADAPAVLAIGDIHLENFGTWRDAEGRLIWGVNDFDEAATMPWPLDLVRLATSAVLARDDGSDLEKIAAALLQGYADGLAAPAPIVLERDFRWLRQAVLLGEADRNAFWDKLDRAGQTIPARFATILAEALPAPLAGLRCFARTAGSGSLGRPRFVAIADWLGGPVVREAKALLPSAWTLAHPPQSDALRGLALATGRWRAPDPHYRLIDRAIVRRLSPSSRKIEVKSDADLLVREPMLILMGREIAACQAGDPAAAATIAADLAARDKNWLADAARSAVAAVRRDYQAYA